MPRIALCASVGVVWSGIGIPFPLPLWERVASQSDDGRGLSPRMQTPHPALRAHLLPQGEKEKKKERATAAAPL